MMILALLASALTVALCAVIAIYEESRIEVAHLRAENVELWADLLTACRERDEARAQAMPRIDADKLLKSIREEREEESNTYGVEL